MKNHGNLQKTQFFLITTAFIEFFKIILRGFKLILAYHTYITFILVIGITSNIMLVCISNSFCDCLYEYFLANVMLFL